MNSAVGPKNQFLIRAGPFLDPFCPLREALTEPCHYGKPYGKCPYGEISWVPYDGPYKTLTERVLTGIGLDFLLVCRRPRLGRFWVFFCCLREGPLRGSSPKSW